MFHSQADTQLRLNYTGVRDTLRQKNIKVCPDPNIFIEMNFVSQVRTCIVICTDAGVTSSLPHKSFHNWS